MVNLRKFEILSTPEEHKRTVLFEYRKAKKERLLAYREYTAEYCKQGKTRLAKAAYSKWKYWETRCTSLYAWLDKYAPELLTSEDNNV